MKSLSSSSAAVLAALALMAACSTEDNGNPEILWLDLDGSEIRVRLVEREPVPF